MSVEAAHVNILLNPKSGECCVIDKALLSDLDAGTVVTWSATEVTGNFKIVFPDAQFFGEEVFYVEGGQSITKEVAPGLPQGLSEDYVIFCLMTGKKVLSDDGISPTIIIGG